MDSQDCPCHGSDYACWTTVGSGGDCGRERATQTLPSGGCILSSNCHNDASPHEVVNRSAHFPKEAVTPYDG